MGIVFDIETESLEDPKIIWCLSAQKIVDGEKEDVVSFERPDKEPKALLDYMGRDPFLIGHNLLTFDLPVCRRLIQGFPEPSRVIDTLVLSRLLNYGITGGHSLEAWGSRLGYKKEVLGITFDIYTKELLKRNISDVIINSSLFLHLSRYLKIFSKALETEQELQILCKELNENGFPFDIEKALEVHKELSSLLSSIDEKIKASFPPKARPIREVIPRRTKSGALNKADFRFHRGNDLTIYTGGPFTRFEYEEFNPSSIKQTIERLNDAGWRPTDKTKGHKEAERDKSPDGKRRLQEFRRVGWKVSEENLRTLPETAPEGARSLAQRIMIASRVSDLEEWMALYDAPKGLIRGKFLGIGSWTQRMAHQGPNMANIPVAKRSSKDSEFETFVNDTNDTMRSLWVARRGYRLIGTDADGIQMRIFAHYVNDERLINALVSGDKETETDIHSVHRRALGDVCKSRDAAKTFIYAWLLGAGIAKVAEILECSLEEARIAVNNFIGFYPSLEILKEEKIPQDARRGYFEGLDGRLVLCDNSHKMLAGYLQNGEKVIMSRACIWWNKELKREKIPFTFRNFVHDEWQTEVPDSDPIARYVAEKQARAIANQTNELSLNCPVVAGKAKFGYSWKETH